MKPQAMNVAEAVVVGTMLVVGLLLALICWRVIYEFRRGSQED